MKYFCLSQTKPLEIEAFIIIENAIHLVWNKPLILIEELDCVADIRDESIPKFQPILEFLCQPIYTDTRSSKLSLIDDHDENQ